MRLTMRLHGLISDVQVGTFDKMCAILVVCMTASTAVIASSGVQIHGGYPQQFVSSAIAATAAFTAIIFAISIMAIQHTTSTYASSVLEVLPTNRHARFTFAIAMFTIIWLSVDLVLGSGLTVLGLFYFLSALFIMGVFFTSIANSIKPMSIINMLGCGMLKSCFRLRVLLTEKQADPAPAMYDRMIAESVAKMERKESALKQMALSSMRNSDYIALDSCLGVYVWMVKEHVRMASVDDGDLHKHLLLFLSSLDLFRERLSRDDTSAVSGLTLSYVSLALESLKGGATRPRTSSAPDVVFSSSVTSLSKLGTDLVLENRPRASEMIVAEMGGIGAKACSEYGEDRGVADRVIDVAYAAMERKSGLRVPLASAVAVLGIVGAAAAAAPDVVAARRTARSLSSMIGALCASELTKEPLAFDTRSGVYKGVTGCVDSVMRREAGTGAGSGGWDAESAGAVVGDLIDVAGGIGTAPEQHGDRPMGEAAARCLSTIAMALARAEPGAPAGKYGAGLARAVERLECMHKGRTAEPREIAKAASDVALYCCIYRRHPAAEAAVDLLCRIAREDPDGRVLRLALATLDLAGCCAAGLGSEDYCGRAARYWRELAANHEAEHGAMTAYDALRYGRWLCREWGSRGEMCVHMRFEYGAPPPERELERLLTDKNMAKFEDAKRALEP